MKPEYAIEMEQDSAGTTLGPGLRILHIREDKARYQGYPIKGSKVLRRKFENLLIITRAKERLYFNYV